MSKKISYPINAALVLALYLVLLAVSGVVGDYYEGILILIGINIILAVGLNLTVGFLGELALGHAGFMAIGAYVSAIVVKSLEHGGEYPWYSMIVGMISGGLVAAVFGFLIGIPALRLRGDYLAIITLGFGEIIRVFIINVPFTGGARGLTGIPELTNISVVYWVAIITIAFSYLFIRSRHGRAVMAIREDIIAAESTGIPATYYKSLTFTITAFFGGIAGSLYAHQMGVLGAETFNFMKSIEILIIVVLGGMGSITGSIVAAIVLTALPELLRAFADWRMLVYSVILIIIMIFKPSGLFGRYEFSLTGIISRIVKKQTPKPQVK